MTLLSSLVNDNNVGGIDILGSWMEIGMVLAAIAVGFWFIYHSIVKNILKRKHFAGAKGFNNYKILHSRIHEILTELRVKCRADRTLIIRFHNGGQFLDGSSIKRFSLTHESCGLGISETRNSRQDILISTFIEMLDHIIDEKPVLIEATSDLPDCHFKRHLESNHTLVYSLVPIKDIRGVLILGCLLVEWCSWDKVDLIDDDTVSVDVHSYAGQIESQLSSGGVK